MQGKLILTALLLVFVCASSAHAQRPSRYQSPSGATISPYLNYFRQDTGVLNQYYHFVRPDLRLRDTIQDLERTTVQQRSQIRNLESDFLQIREPSARPTGTGSGFMNYSHFYPSQRRR